MHKEFKYIIAQYREDESILNRILVSLFVNSNSIQVANNELINSLLIKNDSPYYSLIILSNLKFSFDDLIEAFELAIPNKEKTINGAVYTPNFIKQFIVEQSFIKVNKPTKALLTADISCGCGAFLFTIAQKIQNETDLTYHEIYKNNIFGLDISNSSINRAKILLTLLALSKGEDEPEFEFNLYTGNALSFDWLKNDNRLLINNGLDVIVGNPPYVRAKNIDEASKKILSSWAVTKSGNPDLYIPFFEIGLKLLNEDGVLGYITVNSFFKSVNARELRKYFQTHKFSLSIIDFGNERLFDKKSAYTCICLITKEKTNSIAYKKETSKTLVANTLNGFNHILYKSLNHQKGWLINESKIVENIKRIESTGKSLGSSFKIKNGIATLSNSIYIFKPSTESEDYYVLIQNGKKYEIEKAICRDIIKPNILKFEYEIEKAKEKIIYPYENETSSLSLINEKKLIKKFPKAYQYLLDNKENLQKRDKGNGNYSAWYAFGRTQALSDNGYKLLFPYIGKEPYFVFTDEKEMLLYCGYAIFNDSVDELKILKRILESKVFEYYIKHTSKPYSGGYYSFAKNYVKNFGICDLTLQDKYFISNGATNNEVDTFLIKKYGIEI